MSGMIGECKHFPKIVVASVHQAFILILRDSGKFLQETLKDFFVITI